MSKLIFQSNNSLHVGDAVFVPLISQQEINSAVRDVALKIMKSKLNEPIIIGVLQGGIYFQNLLEKHLFHMGLDFESDIVGLSSYGDAEVSSGDIELYQHCSLPIDGRDIIIVDDIADTLLSFQALRTVLSAQNPKSLNFIPFLKKRGTALVKDFELMCFGLEIDPLFVIGFGLDYKKIQETRKLRDIYYKIE